MDFVFIFDKVLKVKDYLCYITVKNLHMSKQNKIFGNKSYKTRESTLYCIGNSEENIDLSVIYLAVTTFIISLHNVAYC